MWHSGPHCARTLPFGLHSFVFLTWACTFATFTPARALVAQTTTPTLPPPQGSYYSNDGDNSKSDADLGEFGPDLGGFIPFERFDDTRPLLGHVLARKWNAALAGKSFRELMLDELGDLRRLDSQLRKFGKARILPIPASEIVLESPPVQRNTWWGRPMTMYPYRVHGAAVLVCVADSTLASPPDPLHLLLVNYPTHLGDFRVNPNKIDTTFVAPAGGWSGPPGAPLLAPDEQALERGDVVVMTQENISETIWIALQRTQDSEYFVREQLLPSLGIVPDPATSRSFLYGGSWGGLVSACLALLQPKVYAGSASYSMDDWSYGIGDQRMLTSFHQAANGMLAPELCNDPFYAPFYAMVDILGIRFDDPKTLASGKTMQPWDVAAFCLNRREFELAVPVQGMLGGEDWIFNCHWSAENAAFNPNFTAKLRKNLEHGGVHGVLPGFNEYSVWKGDEWATLIAGATNAAANAPLVPDTPLPHGLPAYPDPYDSTLRHVHVATGPEDFLTEIDLSHASHNPGSGVRSLGQGVWPARDDSMFIGNADSDPRTEVVFGNLDGHVHVMEIDPARDPADPLRLYDEWKSPYLGRELYSLAVSGRGAGTKIYAGDGLGQIWRIQPGANGFDVTGAPFCSPQTAPKYLYPGPVRHLSIGDFASARPGLELIAFNRHCDWAMFAASNGAPIPGGRLQRGLHALGPSAPTVIDVDADGDDELLVPCMDGFVWMLDPGVDGDFAKGAEPNPVKWSGFMNQALYRIEPVDLDPAPGTSHLIVIGRNDGRPAAGFDSPNLMTIFSTTDRKVVGEIETTKGDGLDSGSFAWFKKPTSSQGGVFAIGGATGVHKFGVRLAPAVQGGTTVHVTSQGSVELVELEDENLRANRICALEDFKANGRTYVLAALGTGRFVALDSSLQWARDSSAEYENDPDVTGNNPEQPWYSNRTLARTFACDLVQETPGGDASLYFAEFALPLLRSPRRNRVGKLDLPAIGDPTWDPYVVEAPNGAGHPSRGDFNRRLRFADAAGDGTREPHVYAEAGDFFYDSTHERVREFSDVAWHPAFFPNPDPLQWKLLGGMVFEIDDLLTGDYRYLGGFFTPRDASQPYADYGGNDWWYPQTGPNRLSGQIANHSQSVFEHTLGTSMKIVELPDPFDPSRVVPHVVTGTNGGYVYAIEPGDPATATSGLTSSRLTYASIDLGTNIVGMDAGNLDDDPDNEIAVGAYIDAGSYDDWVNGDKGRNRAHLVVLDPQPSATDPGAFVATELDGDDLVGYGQGIGAGVTGVKVDDVNGDGVNELWCGDAVGHVWLFRRVSGQWECFFRSADLAAYPGIYNNLHPIKDANGRTVKLIVVSAGYVMGFTVDWQRL